jgi:hypothetical protein
MQTHKYKQANNFEEYIYDYFNDELNITLSHFVSKKGQYERGENRQGVEIKNDQSYNKYNNLFISVLRKYPDKQYPSGIFRETKTKQMFYVIGDQNNFWLFSTKQLKDYYNKNNPELKKGFTTQTGGTDYGFLLSISKANQLCIHKYSKQLQLC